MNGLVGRTLEAAAIILLPLVLIACVLLGGKSSALLIFLSAVFSLVVFFASWETSRPALRQIMPVAVLSAVAAAGRIVLAAVPNVQPVTAICVIAGCAFGRQAGFMTGSLTAFVSNCFLGQGAWTPWQMYAWGLVGYFAGVLFSSKYANKETTQEAPAHSNDGCIANGVPHAPDKHFKLVAVCIYGCLASYLFSFLMDTWAIVGFFNSIGAIPIVTIYAAGLLFDTAHAISTVAFLLILYPLWEKKLVRIKKKYGLGST